MDVQALTNDIKENGFPRGCAGASGGKLTNWLSLYIRKADKAAGEFIRGWRKRTMRLP